MPSVLVVSNASIPFFLASAALTFSLALTSFIVLFESARMSALMGSASLSLSLSLLELVDSEMEGNGEEEDSVEEEEGALTFGAGFDLDALIEDEFFRLGELDLRGVSGLIRPPTS